MTEDEAKTKCCPLFMSGLGLQMVQGGAFGQCIGSACMMWRWEFVHEFSDKVEENWGRWRFADPFEPIKEGEIKTNRGYCGLAGKS